MTRFAYTISDDQKESLVFKKFVSNVEALSIVSEEISTSCVHPWKNCFNSLARPFFKHFLIQSLFGYWISLKISTQRETLYMPRQNSVPRETYYIPRNFVTCGDRCCPMCCAESSVFGLSSTSCVHRWRNFQRRRRKKFLEKKLSTPEILQKFSQKALKN